LVLPMAIYRGAGASDLECKDDVCFGQITKLKVFNPDTNNRDLPLQLEVGVKKTDLVRTCLPGVGNNFLADTFDSCEGKNMKKVCKYAKRGWLITDDNKQTVENSDVLLQNFGKIKGGEDAVKSCLKVDEYEYNWEYEYYDYEYYDDYDYLEEADGAVRRVRRSPENGNKKKCNPKKGDKCKRKRMGKGKKKAKNNKPCNPKKDPKCKPSKRNRTKKAKKPNKKNKKDQKRKLKNKEKKKEKKIKKNKKKDKKQDKEDNNDNSEPKSDRKYTANKPKDKENDAKIQARLDALDLKSIPSQETLMRLDCIYKKVPQLLENCGKLKLERP